MSKKCAVCGTGENFKHAAGYNTDTGYTCKRCKSVVTTRFILVSRMQMVRHLLKSGETHKEGIDLLDRTLANEIEHWTDFDAMVSNMID